MIQHIYQVNKPLNTRYSIIIPAAGLGTRMKSLGAKCLIEVNGKKLFDRQRSNIAYNIKKFDTILVSGFDADNVNANIKQSRNIKIVHNEEYTNTNTVYSIGLGLSKCSTDHVIIINGDLIFNRFTMSAPFGHDSMIIMDADNGLIKQREVGVITNDKTKKVENIMYGLPKKWAQITYLTGRELEMAKKLCNEERTKKWFTFELLNAIIDMGGVLMAYQPRNIKIMDIDLPTELDEANQLIW